MTIKQDIKASFEAAFPIIMGYVAIGVPCGILSSSIGLDVLQVFLLSALFYSGAGQFMIPNMFLAGNPLVSIIASISLVNTRQMLYSASLAQYCMDVKKRLSFLFAATVTDESFGVNTAKFEEGDWSVRRATMVNLMSQTSWALSNVVGVLVGNAIDIPLAMASYAMTAIFICLASTQRMTVENGCAIGGAFIGVYVFKLVGLGGVAILGGALAGVFCAVACFKLRSGTHSKDIGFDLAEKGAISDRAVFSARNKNATQEKDKKEDDAS